MTVRGEDEDLRLEEGEHVTFVDVITDTKIGDMKPQFDKKTGRSGNASGCASPSVTIGPR